MRFQSTIQKKTYMFFIVLCLQMHLRRGVFVTQLQSRGRILEYRSILEN
jgi:hypothetical protein